MHMARDLFLTDTGEKIPTINEYTELFGVSRGIVQNALETLTEDGSITMEKRGVLGTFLVSKDDEKLYAHTGWGAITGSMPIPLTPYFTSLATAVCEGGGPAGRGLRFRHHGPQCGTGLSGNVR